MSHEQPPERPPYNPQYEFGRYLPQQGGPPQGSLPPPPPPKQSINRTWKIILGVLSVIALIVVVAAVTKAASGGGTPSASASSPAANSAVQQPAVQEYTDPNGETCAQSDEDASGYCPGDSAPPPPPPSPAATYPWISSSQWAQVVKDPNGHAGETYTLTGTIFQFDTNTGPANFMANVGPNDDTTWFDGDANALNSFVSGDSFTAKVRVVGEYDYTTEIGGSNSVPELAIVSITKG